MLAVLGLATVVAVLALILSRAMSPLVALIADATASSVLTPAERTDADLARGRTLCEAATR